MANGIIADHNPYHNSLTFELHLGIIEAGKERMDVIIERGSNL